MDDDATTRDNLAGALEDTGHLVATADGCAAAIARLSRQPFDVVVSDVQMAGGSGIELLEYCARRHAELAVILVTGHGTIELAVEAVRKGAHDFITKPVDLDHLELVIEKAAQAKSLARENAELRQALRAQYSFGSIIGRSAPMQRVFEQVERVAPTQASVLINGESGAGKELIATAIHVHSARSAGPLVKVNCMALAEGLLESELFGHEKGSFTGAHRARKGRIELAHGGTLFLDEIGDLSLPVQLKLLRVLQEREIERVGGNLTIPVDIRLVVATNRDLAAEVAAGRFREELYYRIRVVTIDVPPLRERRDDIPLLVAHFIGRFNETHGKHVRGLTPAALRLATSYAWPGNVRELRNCVESLVVMSQGETIDVEALPDAMRGEEAGWSVAVPAMATLAEAERLVILETLRQVGNNKAQAARVLGIGKKTLYRKLAEFGALEPGGDAAD